MDANHLLPSFLLLPIKNRTMLTFLGSMLAFLEYGGKRELNFSYLLWFVYGCEPSTAKFSFAANQKPDDAHFSGSERGKKETRISKKKPEK